MKPRAGPTALAALLACVAGCCRPGNGDDVLIADHGVRAWVEPANGTFSFRAEERDVAAEGVHLAAVIESGAGPRLVTTRGRAADCRREQSGGQPAIACSADTGHGLTASFRLTFESSDPALLLLATEFSNTHDEPLVVYKIHPFRVAPPQGGVSLGAPPASLRILQNGTDQFIDYYVDLLAGDTPLSDPDVDPLFAEHSSYSNGSMLIHHPAGGSSLLAGFVDLDWAIPLVATGGDEQALSHLLGEARYPQPVSLPPGGTISGGTAVFVPGARSAFEALESYADHLAAVHDVHLPPRPLSGWDSWYTSFANTDIDAAFILGNAESLEQLLGAFGLDSMQVDMGWHDTWGDWQGHAGFPQGMGAIADAISARGLAPELWIAPLSAEESSQVFQNHAGSWFVDKNLWGKLLMGPAMHPFDLRREDVLEHIRGLGERVHAWGFQSIKMDFAYYALYSALPPDPHVTPVALYRRAVHDFREALGPGIHFINIAMWFPNIGLVDTFRLGLDDWPCWEGGSDCEAYVSTGGKGAQGIKPLVRMAARRYWMNGRLWWNHHDQVYLRELDAGEVRALVSLAGLSGGSVSLGEDVRELAPGDVDPVRRILPLTGLTARPLDLFTRAFPEIWHLALDDGDVLGLFHWGANRDLSVLPFRERADGEPITHQVTLEDLGLQGGVDYLTYEFWGGASGVVRDLLTVELEPHSARVYRLLRMPAEPAYIATDRHLLMGPSVVEEPDYDERSHTLNGFVHTVQAFEQTLVFWIPDGFRFSSVAIDGVHDPVTRFRGDNLLEIGFTGVDTARHDFQLVFD